MRGGKGGQRKYNDDLPATGKPERREKYAEKPQKTRALVEQEEIRTTVKNYFKSFYKPKEEKPEEEGQEE